MTAEALNTVKMLLGIEDNEQDSLLSFLIDDTVNMILGYCRIEILPRQLESLVPVIVADAYRAKGYGQETAPGVIKSVSEGDRSVSYADTNPDNDFFTGYYDRLKPYINRKGRVPREYNEAMTDLNHSMWDEALDAYDNMLQKQQDYISDMREQFQKEEQALQDSWTIEDRKIDMSEVSAQLDIYAGAVTDRGQQKYRELEEQMKQLQRDEELYQLQVRNNATIEGLEADYKILEENKANVLNELRATDMNISGYVESLTQNISQSSSNVEGLLSTLISKFDNFKVEHNNMSDNRKVTYNLSQLTPEQIQNILDEAVGR